MIEFVCWSTRDKRRKDTRDIAYAGLFVQEVVRSARGFEQLHPPTLGFRPVKIVWFRWFDWAFNMQA